MQSWSPGGDSSRDSEERVNSEGESELLGERGEGGNVIREFVRREEEDDPWVHHVDESNPPAENPVSRNQPHAGIRRRDGHRLARALGDRGRYNNDDAKTLLKHPGEHTSGENARGFGRVSAWSLRGAASYLLPQANSREVADRHGNVVLGGDFGNSSGSAREEEELNVGQHRDQRRCIDRQSEQDSIDLEEHEYSKTSYTGRHNHEETSNSHSPLSLSSFPLPPPSNSRPRLQSCTPSNSSPRHSQVEFLKSLRSSASVISPPPTATPFLPHLHVPAAGPSHITDTPLQSTPPTAHPQPSMSPPPMAPHSIPSSGLPLSLRGHHGMESLKEQVGDTSISDLLLGREDGPRRREWKVDSCKREGGMMNRGAGSRGRRSPDGWGEGGSERGGSVRRGGETGGGRGWRLVPEGGGGGGGRCRLSSRESVAGSSRISWSEEGDGGGVGERHGRRGSWGNQRVSHTRRQERNRGNLFRDGGGGEPRSETTDSAGGWEPWYGGGGGRLFGGRWGGEFRCVIFVLAGGGSCWLSMAIVLVVHI
eukprot:GHVQ01015034.1.p1 GENE.GHVQ01015034.1~~GHVQ01015034.1.p1  ORF type:complete len:537 (+),score=117.41 GHVQ01015034.1:264-1874(+)